MNIVYTANYGSYDTGLELDDKFLGRWNKLILNTPPDWLSGFGHAAASKIVKIMPWFVLGDDWEYCLWLDSSIRVEKALDSMPKGDGILTRAQTSTDDFYRELDRLMVHKRSYLDRARVKEVKQYYKASGFVDTVGGINCCWIMRRNSEQVKKICSKALSVLFRDRIWRDQPAWRVAGGIEKVRGGVGIKVRGHKS